MNDETVISKNNFPIRLTDERWQHIVSQHPELEESPSSILDTVAFPERIVAGSDGELLAIRSVEIDKWLIVVYRELETDGFIITAFFTRRFRSLEKRVVIWSE
jgi:hypothetical protein